MLAGFGTIGGALFGFDVSSMSAWIGTDQYLEYFHHPDSDLQGGVSRPSIGDTVAGKRMLIIRWIHFRSPRPCPLALLPVLSRQASYQTESGAVTRS